MFVLFTLLNIAALISVIVFLVKMIKLKISGKDNTKVKKTFLGMIAACIITFILMVATVPKSASTTEIASDISSKSSQEVILEKGTLELPATATTQETVNKEVEADLPVETAHAPANESDAKENFNKSFISIRPY